MTSTLGQIIRLTTFGESHGPALGGILDGIPGGILISRSQIQTALTRRRPGQSTLTTPRSEEDQLEILSGLDSEGRTLGSPIAFMVRNKNHLTQDYGFASQGFRPSHGDYTYWQKYGVLPQPGGGRGSARETLARVAAGAIAEQILLTYCPGISFVAWVQGIHTLETSVVPESRAQVDAHPTRCPDISCQEQMAERILEAKKEGDSLGGVIACSIGGVPRGLGEPIFDKLEADLAKAMLSIPASRGFEVGSGFGGTKKTGSQENDSFVSLPKGDIGTRTNRSGGIQGGISNGEEIYFRVAFKPTSSLSKPQETVSLAGAPMSLLPIGGRHDPCVLPRAVPIVEAMAALVVCDHFFRQKAISGDTSVNETI